jgi:hypothetical protein
MNSSTLGCTFVSAICCHLSASQVLLSAWTKIVVLRQMEKLRMSKAGAGAAASRKRQTVVPDAALLTKYQHSLAQFRQHKRAKGDRETATLSLLKSFTAKLKDQRKEGSTDGGLRSVAEGVGDEKKNSGDGYGGKLKGGIDHRAYLPTAWRVCHPVVLLELLPRGSTSLQLQAKEP